MKINSGRISSLRRRAAFRRKKREALDSLHLGRFTIALANVVALTVLMSIHFLPDRIRLSVGDRSPTEIRAARSVRFVDTDASLQRRLDAATRVPPVYEMDRTALAQATRYVSDLFDTVARVRGNSNASPMRQLQTLSMELGGVFTLDKVRYFLDAKPVALDNLRATAKRLVETTMTHQIRSDTDDLAHARQELTADAKAAVTSTTEASILSTLGGKALRVNYKPNEVLTRQQREAAMRAAPPVIGEIRAGDTIFHSGDVFTQRHLDQCTALGFISPSLDLPTFLSIFALAGGMVFLVGYYLRRSLRDIYENPRLLILLSSVVFCAVVGLKLFGQVLGLPLSMAQVGYFGLMMVVAAGMIISELLSSRLAILVTALLSVQSGLLMNHELRFSVMTLMTSIVGIYAVDFTRNRNQLPRATLAVGLTNLILVWVLGGLLGDTTREIAYGSVWAVLAGAFAVAIFWFGVVLLEKPFGILTRAWLLELSSSEHPLLRELCLTAPGTYAHSVMVGNLAEAGAEAMGADKLYCRVASYYHDVGKMRRPHCFVENQHRENIHDKLNPSLSALVIASHVRDGLEIADEHKLPAQIKSVIAEHHGTSLIRYFYHQAVLDMPEDRFDPILEQHFRYEGPKPQSRESGIIMLADTVEAAARSLEKPTPSRVQNLVQTLIREKMTDGQLDECDLTFKDIGKIEEAFTHVLCGMLHARIGYPELQKSPLDESVRGSVRDQSLPISTPISHAGNDTELPGFAVSEREPASGRPEGAPR